MQHRFWLYALIILLCASALRLVPLSWPSFFEPDNYIYYSVAGQVLANHLIIPLRDNLSGYPAAPYDEHPGLVVLPALLAAKLRIPLAAVFQFLPAICGMIGVVMAYLLAYELSRNRTYSLLAMAFAAFWPAALIRGMASEWRGEVFIEALAPLAIWLMLKAIQIMHSPKPTRRLGYGALGYIGTAAACAAAWCCILAIWMWKGGIYIAAPVISFLLLSAVAAAIPRFQKHAAILYAIAISAAYLILNPTHRAASLYILELLPPSASTLLSYFGLGILTGIMGMILLVYLIDSRKAEYEIMAILSLFMPAILFTFTQTRWLIFSAVPLAALSSYFLYYCTRQKPRSLASLGIAFAWASLLFSAYLGIGFMSQLRPADNITVQFIASLSWLRSNTPSNSLILTMWPDGSLVEGIANRTSYTDSVISQNQSKIAPFERWLFAHQGNESYIDSLTQKIPRPVYLLVRRYWFQEKASIAAEAGLAPDSSTADTNFNSIEAGDAPYPLLYDENGTLVYALT